MVYTSYISLLNITPDYLFLDTLYIYIDIYFNYKLLFWPRVFIIKFNTSLDDVVRKLEEENEIKSSDEENSLFEDKGKKK